MKHLKSLPARQIEAGSRARTLRVRVEVVVPQRHYRTRSQTQQGVSYNIDRTSTGWTCECDGYFYTGCCKHIAGVARRADREGWNFGRIAPIERAAPATGGVSADTRSQAMSMLTGGRVS